jgi:glutamate-1-semialdehyde 2,1-aminomutase
MVFSKLFKKGESPQPPAPEPEDDEPGDDTAEVAGEPESESGATRAAKVIPMGASTGSKRIDALYGDAEAAARHPTHFVKASGCHLVTAEGDTLLDCTMALGSVSLGYAEPQLTRAVIETLANGSVSGLSPALEVHVAEQFCGVVPCAERVQFLKTGAEAMSAAVRIARTYTNRSVVVGSGYFGWHDWSSTSAGVPASTKRDFRAVPFDDIPALEKAVADAGSDLAAIVIEPVVERLPSKEWVARARALCDDKGAALVFDEMKTGFRLATAGYQQYAEITPDLAAFGKAMANGFPIAAVCGRADLMDAASKTWISSTLASEAGSLAAVSAMLSWHDRADICKSLWEIGAEMREAVGNALGASGMEGVTIDGIDPMWFLRFTSPRLETAFLLAAVENGVLLKRGAYNFAAIAHDDEAIRELESGTSAAFVALVEGAQGGDAGEGDDE